MHMFVFIVMNSKQIFSGICLMLLLQTFRNNQEHLIMNGENMNKNLCCQFVKNIRPCLGIQLNRSIVSINSVRAKSIFLE